MDELQRAIDAAFGEFYREYGKDATLEEGTQFITVFNNCSLVVTFEDKTLKTEFVGGQPFRVDMALSIFEEE